MADCCTDILSLGCINSCDNISTNQDAPATGVYTLVSEDIQIVSATVTIGDEIVFAGGYLNEDKITIFKIKKPDGTYLTASTGEDCYQVDVSPSSTPTLAVATVCSCTYDVYVNSVFYETVALDNCEDLTINIV